MPKGGARPGSGRKKKVIDLEELEKLCQLNCTLEEIAAFFDTTSQTIKERMAANKAFREVVDRGRAKGRLSVRRMQMRLANEGNPTMCIWLGKQLLGQKDRMETATTAGAETPKLIVQVVQEPEAQP